MVRGLGRKKFLFFYEQTKRACPIESMEGDEESRSSESRRRRGSELHNDETIQDLEPQSFKFLYREIEHREGDEYRDGRAF